jgi:hypothetical protein
MKSRFVSQSAAALLLAVGQLTAESTAPPASEKDAYPVVDVPFPDGEVIEPGAIELLSGQRVAVGTRRGEIWVCSGLYHTPIQPQWKLWASGLHEILGLADSGDGWLSITHRPGVERMKDTDGDGRADVLESLSGAWGIGGDYHEYAFGSRPDAAGNIWVTLCLTGSFSSAQPFRGWAVRITPQGEMIPTVCGVRSPGGISTNAAGDFFYTDNQGPWNGTSSLKWLKPGSFAGHPDGNKWFSHPAAKAMGERPPEPATNSRMVTERARVPQLIPPACYLPHSHVGQSASGIACDQSGGAFGPFREQLFVGDQCYSNVTRVSLEKVNGLYQGACVLFRQDFPSGCVPLRMDDQAGFLFYGGTERGWGSRGGRVSCLSRIHYGGNLPFEIHSLKAEKDGFTVRFTQPADPKTLTEKASWKTRAFTYIYRSDYGSPEVDELTPEITALDPAPDGTSVRVHLNVMTRGHIHEFKLPGVKTPTGQPLLHETVWYTLNEIPQ